ncbi:MBL fold metallo-hydrolase [Micromonospora sp. NPDC050417]|uniref:MBL fold metallo-hydrolase n=1 Tax=Micromonospora sp. NPDC050417 TaxID=3364280 RepID=UPI0037A150F4
MASLEYSTFIAPPKPVVSDSPPPGETERKWSPTTATLIYGDRDAVLVDALMTAEEGRHLADFVAATGRNLTTIYITHGHGDHFFGASVLLDRFPEARLVATVRVVERLRRLCGQQQIDYWRSRFPGQLPERLVMAEPMSDHALLLEGERLVAVELGHSDTDDTTALYVPTIGLVVAGDAVYNDVHLHLGESGGGRGRAWLDALDTVESLHPVNVVAGHKRDGAGDGPEIIEETRTYIQDFEAEVARTNSALDLYEAMLARYPDRVNKGVLWDSARAVKE